MIALLVTFILLVTSPASAQLAITTLMSSGGGDATCNGPTATTASISPTAGALVLLTVTTEVSAGTAGTVTAVANGGSVTFTEVGNVLALPSNLFLRTTLLRATGVTAGTITITISADQSNCQWAVLQVTGQDTSGTNGSGAIAQVVTNSTAGGASSLTVTLGALGATGNATVGAFGYNQSTDLVVGSGFTQIGTQSNCCGGRAFFEAKNPHASDTTVDVTPASGTGIFTGVAAEIKVATAVTTTPDETQILGRVWDWLDWLFSPSSAEAATYYLDANLAADCTTGNYSVTNRACNGSDGNAYNDLQDVCGVITARVGSAIKGDDIIIREGTYVRGTTGTAQMAYAYDCLLNGTSGDHSVMTAKTCAANAPGCIQRHDGNWYEKVTFDSMRRVTETWTTTATTNVYKATINFVQANGATDNFYVDKPGTCIAGQCPFSSARQVADSTLNYGFSGMFIGPYRLLLDGQPSIWYDYDYTLTEAQNAARLTAAGSHTFNRGTKTLFAHFRGDKDPRTGGLVETWKEDVAWMRARFEFVDIKGIEIRGFFRLWRPANNNGVDYLKDFLMQGYQWTDMVTSINDVKGKNFTEYDTQPGVSCPNATSNGCTTYAFRARMKFYDGIIVRQAGEIFQISGDDHELMRNVVIDGSGQWSGGFEGYPKTNPRSGRNAKIYYNWFYGHVGSRRNAQMWLMETTSEHRKNDGSFDCEFQGQEWVGNLFELALKGDEVLNASAAIDTKGTGTTADDEYGWCTSKNVKYDNNIFLNFNVNDRIFRLLTNMQTSEIKNNLFYSKNAGTYIDVLAPARFLSQTNSLSVSDNIFMNGATVFDSDFCGASGVTLTRNLFSGNTSNGCTGGTPITTAATFANVDDRDFRPASAGAAQVVSGLDVGPYDFGTTPPTGMDFWNIESEIAPRILSARVLEGATNKVVVDFQMGLPAFSFPPLLGSTGVVPTTAAMCAGLTVKKNGVLDALTDCDRVTDTQWSLTVTTPFACNDTGTNGVTVSYDPTVGQITDSALPVELRQELVEATDLVGANLITTGCGVAPPLQPVFTLTSFRLKRWPGPVESTDWLADQDAFYRVSPGSLLRARVQVVNSVAAGNISPVLQCNAASGSYFTVTEDCTGDGITDDAPFCFVPAPDITDPGIPAGQLTACGGTLVSGQMVMSDVGHPTVTTALNGCFESEFALQVKVGLNSGADPLRCQLIDGQGVALPFGGALTSTTNWMRRISPRTDTVGGLSTGGVWQ